jgi:hemoglobin
VSVYELLGGEEGVRALANRFYDEMDRRPEVATLRAMHPDDLSTTRERFFWFLSGWLGGPQLFVERVGHPRLRARHFPFAVDAAARDEWMLCMRSALAPAGLEADVLEKLDAAFAQLANHMINRG